MDEGEEGGEEGGEGEGEEEGDGEGKGEGEKEGEKEGVVLAHNTHKHTDTHKHTQYTGLALLPSPGGRSTGGIHCPRPHRRS